MLLKDFDGTPCRRGSVGLLEPALDDPQVQVGDAGVGIQLEDLAERALGSGIVLMRQREPGQLGEGRFEVLPRDNINHY